MSSKTKREVIINIEAHIETKCVVTTTNDDEDALNYAKNAFIESMESRGIYVMAEPKLTVVEPPPAQEQGNLGL